MPWDPTKYDDKTNPEKGGVFVPVGAMAAAVEASDGDEADDEASLLSLMTRGSSVDSDDNSTFL
jgi:hypothetical protein